MYKVLPDDLYEKLSQWNTAFQQKSNHKEYYKNIHIQISKNNIDSLENNEINILNNLLTEKNQIINKDNLWDYFWHFEKIQSESHYKKHQKQQRKEQLEVQIKLLQEYKFQESDRLFTKNKKIFNQLEYEKEKAKYIKKYFEEEFVKKGIIENSPDLEQAEAIGALGKDVLVSARAGSGKTQTISGKVAFLVKKYDIDPKEILVLCFNKSAAENMKNRIKKLVPEFKNARTFHSWAMKILFNKECNEKNEKQILISEDGVKSNNNLDNFVQDIIKQPNNDFQKELYHFLKSSPKDDYENNNKFYQNTLFKIKNHKKEKKLYPTLSGEMVKSLGEKWIADFLFENGFFIPENKKENPENWKNKESCKIGIFSYEKFFSPKGLKGWNPDFTLFQNNKIIIWEHWAIDKNDNFIFNNYKKGYLDKKNKIRNSGYKFFNNKDILDEKLIFLETKSGDIEKFKKHEEYQTSRSNFETLLKNKLIKCGVIFPNQEEKRLIKEKILKIVSNREEEKQLQNFTSFISYVQQKDWNNWKIELNKIISNQSERSKIFIKLAIKITELYLEKIDHETILDFNKILKETINKIKNSDSNFLKFKYILIDEFQDFSQLFQNLINAIREKNSDVNLFCVGDSWQLINGFAGSDEQFFKEFQGKANNKKILTCYRSFEHIVSYSNNFAKKQDKSFEKSKVFYKYKKCSQKEEIESIINFVENKNKELDKFKIDKKSSDFELEKQLKKSFEIIKENPNKSILILSRNKKVKYVEIEKICEKLYNLLIKDIRNFLLKKVSNLEEISKLEKEKKKFIAISTIHKSKGLEADIVILLDICEKTIPSIHPSNELFEIFGRTPRKILDEEKRLFYVAITRAKEKLFILTEEGNESEFLSKTKFRL